MAVLSGKHGTLKLGGRVVAPLTQWKLELWSDSAAYVANDTGGAKRRVPGPDDCAGSFLCRATEGGHCPVARGQQVVAELHVDDTGQNYYAAAILIDRLGVECDVAGGQAVLYAVRFSGDGPVVPHGILNGVA